MEYGGGTPLPYGSVAGTVPLLPPTLSLPIASLMPTAVPAIPSARLNVATIPALPMALPTAAKITAVAKPGEPAEKLSTARLAALFDGVGERPASDAVPEPAPNTDRETLKSYKRVLADGTGNGDALIRPFGFLTPNGWRRARSAGLEGFLYTKRELARDGVSTLGQLDDQFTYVDALLAGAPWAASLRAKFSRLAAEALPAAKKEKLFDQAVAAAVGEVRERMSLADAAAWGRRSATYMIFARAYNRLRPGKNFLDSLDDAELARIRSQTHADEVWLMDVFEIGDINRWGTGGGSSYSIKGYRVKSELGGDEGLKAFVRRAHAAGLRVKLDFVPNHTSLDSDMVENLPEGLLHILPPQDLTDEQIMASITPSYQLVRTASYPMPDGTRRPARILVHHPRTDYGDAMWIDMAQIDYSRPEARAWQTRQLSRLFTVFGVDSVRRDMAYEVLNTRFYHRWVRILENELTAMPAGWMREGHLKTIEGLKARWAALGGAEFLEEATDAAKAFDPRAVFIDEAYGHTDELSRAGSDGVYNKNDHDKEEGQIGLYDAMQSGDADRIRRAQRHAAFRRWQRGGAPLVNFIGTHDGGEGNPVDKFDRRYKAAALTALMLRPILLYNGVEQGVGQRDNLIGDLSQSVDTAKAIPYDIPVLIDWTKADPEKQSFLELVLGVGAKNQELFDRGAMEVLATTPDTPIAAWTVSHKGKTFLMAANWSEERAHGNFRLDKPVLSGLGAFVPKAGRRYTLRDLAHLDADGRPVELLRDGKDLLENGLHLELDGGGVHLFEVVW